MQLKELAKVSDVTKTFNDIVNSGVVSNLAFKDVLEGISNQEKINIVSQSALNETQKIGALASAGLTAEELKQTVQTGSLSASQATTTTTTLGLGTAFKGLGIKIKQATASMWAFMASNPITMLIAGIAAIATATYGAIKASDAWLNRTKKNAEKSTEAYNDIRSQIDELNTELKTNSDRIDELNAKEHLTLIESEELQKLKESNRELENQIALKQKLAETELRESREETLKYFNEGGGWVGNKETHDAEWADRINFAKYQLEELKKVQEKINEAEKEIALIDTSTTQGKSLYKQKKTELDSLRQSYDIFLKKVQDSNDTFSKLDDNLIGGKDDQIINRLQEFYNLLNETLTGVAQTHTDTISATLAKVDFQSTSKQLEELGKSGKLSVATLSSQFPELIGYLDKAGVSAEELYQYIMALSNPNAVNYNEVEKQFKDSLNLLRDGAIKRGSDMQVWNDVEKAFADNDWNLVLEAYLKVNDQYGDHPEGWNADDWISNIQSELDKNTLNLSTKIDLSNILTNSQESLDKLQSSIKSAADAYSTLMSGSYSSTNLVDSIQEINKAVTDMGGSLNWEFIDSQKNSLELLGNAIELISEKYAESVLSGAGIDVDSKFGQMLANNIIQAQKSTTQLEVLDDQIGSLQSAYKDLTDIVSTYNETGYITFDQLQILLEMEPQYLSCLVDENGQLQLNEAAMTALANKRLDDAEAQAVQQAITELGQLALQDEKTAVEKNAEAFTNAVDDLASYNTELANTIAEATVGASAIRDLNAAISGAESQGANDTQINTVLDNLKTKLQLIENVREKVASGGLGSVIKSGGGSSGSSSSSKDLWKEAYENELKELEHMHELGLISDEQYWQDRMDLNEKYFGESSGKHQKYLDEYRDNEEDILKGIKDLWKDYYDDRKNDLKDLISYAEKLYDKEIDGLESAKEQIEERRDAEEKYWQGRIDAIDNEIDALEDANDQRQRAIDLQEKQYQLQKAMHQRTILLYSENKGMHYVNDTKAERDARNDLDSANHDIKVADLKKQQDELQKQLDIILESYDAQIESINKQIDSLKEIKSAWSDIVDNQEFKELEERLKSLFGDDVKGNILSGNEDFLNSVIAQYSSTSDMLRTIEDATLADIQNMVAQYGILPENLMTITNAANDIANAFSTVDVSGFNTSLDNIAQSSDNVAEKVKNVTTSLNDMSNAISCGSSRSNNKTNKPTQNESDNKGTSLENAIQNETQTAIDAFDQHTDKITNEVIPAIHSATDEMNAFNAAADVDIEKTITIHYETIGNPGGVSGNAHAEGTVGNAFANGTGAYKGLPKAEKNALVSEYGQTEMTVLPNGKTIITDTPTIMDLPKDTVIYNEEQTKKIMDNKVDTSGNAHADGTDADGWITLADGRQIRPLQPGDRTYDMMQKVNAYLESIDYNIEKLTPNSFYERNREMNKMADQISYVSSITNNNRNVQQPIHNDIHVTLPNVTNATSAESLLKDLESIGRKKYQVNW